MSLPQTECSAPPGEHASVNVSPTLAFSDEPFASHDVGVPLPAEDDGTEEDGPGFELPAEALEGPPPVPPVVF